MHKGHRIAAPLIALIVATGCTAIRRDVSLDQDLMMADTEAIMAEFYDNHKRLPTTLEYRQTYQVLLKKGEIESPLPDGWSISYKPYPQSSYPWAITLNVVITVGHRRVSFVENVDKRG
jgi:hypothetical protein